MTDPTNLFGQLSSNIGNLVNINIGNWASAGSDLIGLGGGGLLTAMSGPATASADIGGLGCALAGNVAPAAAGMGGAGAMGAAPILASAGGGSSIGALSVPPSWAGGAGMPAAAERARHAGVADVRHRGAGDWRHDERHRRHAGGRQRRRSRRLELRRPALRRQAEGHAGLSRSRRLPEHPHAANVGRLSHQSHSYHLIDRN